MGAYKRLNKQDVYINTYVAHKPWLLGNLNTGSYPTSTTFESEFGTYGITRILATGSFSKSLAQLYYPSKSQDNIVSHSYDYYYQTTLYNSQSRIFSTSSEVISIPRNLYGNSIQPNTFRLQVFDLSAGTYTTTNDYATDYFAGYDGEANFIIDDGEGALYLEGTSPKQYIGDIIYPHGLAILRTPIVRVPVLSQTSLYVNNIAFKSSLPIYTYTYHCKIKESEYNCTYNRSAQSSSLTTVYDNQGNLYSTASRQFAGQLKDLVTGSSFQPYITTVGLYNDANELIAVAKMGQPIPKSVNTDMTIVVKIDI